MRGIDEKRILLRLSAALPQARPTIADGLAAAVLCVSLATAARSALGDLLQGSQFAMFFAATMLATLAGGMTGGLVALLLSLVVSWFFVAPLWPSIHGYVVGAGLFVVLSSITVIAIQGVREFFSQAKLLQSVLEQQFRELQQSRDMLMSVIDGVPDSIFLFEEDSGDLRIAYVNSAGQHVLSETEYDPVALVAESAAPLDATKLLEAADSEQPQIMQERVLETSKGRRVVEVRTISLPGVRQDSATLLAIIRDVTEFKELEDALRQAYRMEALGQLTGGIAHDFNNLLAIAIGNLDLLEDGSNSEADAHEFVQDARKACLRGVELTSGLLAFARKQTLNPVSTNINELISDHVKLLARLLGADVELRLALAKDLWNAVVDRTQLEVAVTNLATNARDAMPKGGILTISTSNQTLEPSYAATHPDVEPGEYIAVELSDTGQGMTPNIQAHAIEPFFTTKAEGHGTGLGLSMVFGFAKQSGGHVRIYSEAGRGTTVTLLLPRAEGKKASQKEHTEGFGRAIPGETILVVDDNDSLRRVAVKQLAALGYNVIEAANGQTALSILARVKSIDLLLTDIIMPGGLSGVELCHEARKINRDLHVMYMSGFPEQAFGNRVDLDPDVPLLRKPFQKAELGGHIRKVLDATSR